MGGTLLIVVLSVAILIAMGVLVIGVGRIVYGIVRERQKPARVVKHPELGVLTGNGDLWEGTAHPDGQNVRFIVFGNEMAPDEKMLRAVSVIVAQFAEIEAKALAYLRDREPDVRDATLDFYLLDVVSDASFTMEFVAQDGDLGRVWRVEFESGEPKRAAFDD